jgi:Ca2+-binding EF-hand superfamily protein
VVAALDGNHDGVISKEETDNAPAALKALDRNVDGRLTANEFRALLSHR